MPIRRSLCRSADAQLRRPGYFKGLIDELEIFKHVNHNAAQSDGALTQSQLQAIYTAGVAGKCK